MNPLFWTKDEENDGYFLTFNDGFMLAVKLMAENSYSAIATNGIQQYMWHLIDTFDNAKNTAIILYSKASGRAMSGIMKELYERDMRP